MLESLKKLRKYELFDKGVQLSAYMPSDKMADEIQAEVDERYMLLPVDADGVPIHVGDYIQHKDNNPVKVTGVAQNAFHGPMIQTENSITGHWWAIVDETHHVKTRTIDDVLVELLASCGRPELNGYDERAVAKYADELREMMGGAE